MRLADTLLTWLARVSLILAAWTFLAFLTVTAWRLARQAARRRARHQAAREVGEDTLDMLARATRDLPHESHTRGPDAGQPIPYELGDFALWQAEMEDQR